MIKDQQSQNSNIDIRQDMGIDHLEKRFGIIAVEKKFIALGQLFEAMKIQIAEDLSIGTHRLIGKILLEQEDINLSQLEEVLDSMRSKKSVKNSSPERQ